MPSPKAVLVRQVVGPPSCRRLGIHGDGGPPNQPPHHTTIFGKYHPDLGSGFQLSMVSLTLWRIVRSLQYMLSLWAVCRSPLMLTNSDLQRARPNLMNLEYELVAVFPPDLNVAVAVGHCLSLSFFWLARRRSPLLHLLWKAMLSAPTPL